MLTEDQNIVEVDVLGAIQPKEPGEYLFFNNKPDEAVQQVAETAMREIVGKKMDYVLYEGRGDIAARVRVDAKSLDRYKGWHHGHGREHAKCPAARAGANRASTMPYAKQDRERLKNEGEAYANDIVPKAKGPRSGSADGRGQRTSNG